MGDAAQHLNKRRARMIFGPPAIPDDPIVVSPDIDAAI